MKYRFELSITTPTGMTSVIPLSESCPECKEVMERLQDPKQDIGSFEVWAEVEDESGREEWHIEPVFKEGHSRRHE